MACRALLAGLWKCPLSARVRDPALRRREAPRPLLVTVGFVDHGEWGSGQLSALSNMTLSMK